MKLEEMPKLELLRGKIIFEFAGSDVSLNQLLSEYGSNKFVDVSIGEPDSPFDHGRWKDQLKKFKKIGAEDIILINVSEGGYADVVSLQTNIIRILVNEPTIKSLTDLMKAIEDLKPDAINYKKEKGYEYIELLY